MRNARGLSAYRRPASSSTRAMSGQSVSTRNTSSYPCSLQNRDRAIYAHPGVNVLLTQLDVASIARFVVLHKHIVPDFKPLAAGATRRTAGMIGLASVVENFGIGTTRSSRTRRSPPVVFLRQKVNAIIRNTQVPPSLRRFIVARRVSITRKNGDGQTRGIEREYLRQKFATPRQRFLLEIIAERPVAQHLEEGEM